MKNKKIIILLLLFISAFALMFLFFLDFQKKPQVSSELADLYSNFTDFMKETVDSRLEYLRCQPKEYYEKESSICFICDKSHPCFGYGLVFVGEEKMNPGEVFLTEIAELEVEFADFFWQGLASDFNCQKKNNYLDCEMIEFSSKSLGNTLKQENLVFKIKKGINFHDFARRFCAIKETGDFKEIPDVDPNSDFIAGAQCEEYLIFLRANREITILIKHN